jgi:hypothetical protein
MLTVVSNGMGVESIADFLYQDEHPEARLCRDDELIHITAMTGEEYERTEYLMNTYVLPRMAKRGIRYLMVARAGQSDSDGIVVLSDSRATERMVMRGPWHLFQEYRAGVTVPQRGGIRKCSLRSKGFPIDRWIALNIGDQPYQHVIGFNAGESARVAKDQCYGASGGRNAVYPLVARGWSRQDAEDYILQVTGVSWSKSACVGCPFAGRDDLVCRWESEPVAKVADIVAMEHNALAVNERAYLFDGGRSTAEIARASGMDQVADLANARMAAADCAVYEVRRAFPELDADPRAKGRALRSIRRLGEIGDLLDAQRDLVHIAADRGAKVETDRHGIHRARLRPSLKAKNQTFPAAEHFLTVISAEAVDKQLDNFEHEWARITGQRAKGHGVYEVRRVHRPKASNPARTEVLRWTRRIGEIGDLADAQRALNRLAAERHARVETDRGGIGRARLVPAMKTKDQQLPAAEHFLVVSSGAVLDRSPQGFDEAWHRATGQGPTQGSLFDLDEMAGAR